MHTFIIGHLNGRVAVEQTSYRGHRTSQCGVASGHDAPVLELLAQGAAPFSQSRLATVDFLSAANKRDEGALLADMLEVFAVQSVRAADGREALTKLENECIGLVITDLRMPKMTGTELLEAVKNRDPDMPVVLISGFSVESVEDQTILSRADGFLSKPFRMNDIKGILERHFFH